MKNIYLFQKGETIVEVLFAIVVIASALGGAFAIASRSSNTIQDSKEHYQAQLLANSQADALKSYASDTTNKASLDILSQNRTPFCINMGTPLATAVLPNAVCTITNGGAVYSISISSNFSGGNPFRGIFILSELIGQVY